MKRSQAVPLTVISSLAAFLVSCRDDRPARYCVDDDQQIIADSNCNAAHGHWYYLGGHGAYGRGTRLRGGSFVPPSSGFRSPEAGTIRGIFGHAGESFSSFHASSGAHASGAGE